MSDYLTGRIIKGVGSFYSVAAEGETYICRPRGKFRIKDETPMVGDLVEFTPPTNTQEGYLLKILPRKKRAFAATRSKYRFGIYSYCRGKS